MTNKKPPKTPSFLTVAFSRRFLNLFLIGLFLLVAGLVGIGVLLVAVKPDPNLTSNGSLNQNLTNTATNSIKNLESTLTPLPPKLTAVPGTDLPKGQQIETTMGDTLAGYNYVITVDDLAHGTSFNNYLSAGQDNTFLALHVVMESQSEGGVEVNPRYWRLYDDQTPSYQEIYTGKDPSLVTNRVLTRGEMLQGWVTFEIPKDSRRFKLAYDIPNIAESFSLVFDVGYGS